MKLHNSSEYMICRFFPRFLYRCTTFTKTKEMIANCFLLCNRPGLQQLIMSDILTLF